MPTNYFYTSDYGIPANGSGTDHNAKLDPMIAAIIAAGGGHFVIDRPVKLTRPLVFNGAVDVIIEGSGIGSLEYVLGGTVFISCIRLLSCQRTTVRDLRFYATASASRTNCGFGVDAYQSNNVRLENCHFTNLVSGAWFGRCDYVWAENNYVKDPRADGIHFSLGSRWCVGIGNHCEGQNDDCFASTTDVNDANTLGLPYRRAGFISWIGNTCGSGTWGHGIVAYETDNVLIANNTIRGVGGSGIAISSHDDPNTYSTNIEITGNLIGAPGQAQNVLGQAGQTPSGYQYGCGIFLTDARQALVSGNNVQDVTANPNAKKAGILIENSIQTTTKGNRVFNVNGVGIGLSGSLTDTNIHDNDIDYCQRTGIDGTGYSAGFAGFLSLKGNHTRRVGSVSGNSWAVNGAAAGQFTFVNNVDEQLKAASVTSSAGSIKAGNIPAV